MSLVHYALRIYVVPASCGVKRWGVGGRAVVARLHGREGGNPGSKKKHKCSLAPSFRPARQSCARTAPELTVCPTCQGAVWRPPQRSTRVRRV
eukprot:scaffold5323_cov112-Isochrysis_galbana.AAC.4